MLFHIHKINKSKLKYTLILNKHNLTSNKLNKKLLLATLYYTSHAKSSA